MPQVLAGKTLKNLRRLWLAYIELQGEFYMLELISSDSRHFTQPELSLGWSDLHEIKRVTRPGSGRPMVPINRDQNVQTLV